MCIEGIVAIITALSVAVGSVIALAKFHADQNKNREDRKAGDIDLLAKMDKMHSDCLDRQQKFEERLNSQDERINELESQASEGENYIKELLEYIKEQIDHMRAKGILPTRNVAERKAASEKRR